MKKLVFSLFAIFFIASGAMAQDLTSKKGETYLPKEGDWAIGIDAAPFLSYLGNFFNGNTSNSSPTFNFVDPSMTIYGKLFKTDDMAYRARLRFLGIDNTTNLMFSADDVSTTPHATVEDAKGHSQLEVGLGFGIEKRRGNTRLQGVYGAEVFVTYGSSASAYNYGNAITSTNMAPTTSDFGDNLIAGSSSRVTARKNGSYYYAGLRPFIGAEYFILPKISLGGEFGYTIAFGGHSAAEVEVEYWDPVTGAVGTSTYNENTNGSVRLKLDNDNLSGALKLMLHF